MALFKPYKITSNQLASLPIVDGQFIVASDTGQMWIDEGSKRTEIPIHDSIDLSNYITETELTAALAEEASARQKQDNLLQDEIEAKLSSSDLIQGDNITIDYDEVSGQVTLSATDTNTTYVAGNGLSLSGNTFSIKPSNNLSGATQVEYDSGMTSGLGAGSIVTLKHSVNANGMYDHKIYFSGGEFTEDETNGYDVCLKDNGIAGTKLKNKTITADKIADGVIPEVTDPVTYSLSKSGSTITLTGSDGSKTSVTDADTNTTYSAMEGATSSAAGTTGLVPAPAAGYNTRYLRGDGTWAAVVASTADKLTTARTITLTGDITGSTSFDGSDNCSIATTLAANSVTANEIASGAVGLSELSSAVGTVAVQSSTPTDSHVKLWIKV